MNILSARKVPLVTSHVRRACLAAALAGSALISLASNPAHAAAPLQKNQATFYRIMVGDYEVTALSDGTLSLPADKMLNGIDKADLARQLTDAFLSDPVATSVNTYLINTGKKLVLIDTGAGDSMGKNSGHLLASLRAAGYSPAQVDEIYLTHFHPDHTGGLTAGGKRVFPNAVVRADSKESAYWFSAQNAAQATHGSLRSFAMAPAALKPYLAAHKFVPFDHDGELSPGISSVANYGHTPGHNAYRIASKGQELLIFGDLVHVGAVQFAHPEVTISFDSDESEASGDRRQVFETVATRRELVAGAHIPFPGIGHIAKAGSGYRWHPVEYSLPQ
ncbi:MBL fold metallo-hydrolase [Bordetella sp. N]|uniref:MBL fold metallo-hydrolase n=1 Tax=Bordetella sp. N TaxID=1746199 RepID=UPI00070EB9CD|nr:MBL fold metallo-hydrolase [Bordetella sp. N]ALM86545.1 MBL fold metallo-hydrolase [Bordetella sp. N]